MAKINLTANHNNQENLGAIASLGVLMCMIVTVVGIKLWWFKQRLSFEPNSTENATANGATPPLVVPRRNRQARYKKDKRYSQKIYDSSVEVHGVFRKKNEDDEEIQSPRQLPPIRLQQSYGSTSSLILPPPRSKRHDRKQIHSTAFEDLEITTPTTPIFATSSSSDLTAIKGSGTKLNFTFEEFEKQFKFKELNAKIPESPRETSTDAPVPPLRLNRSSSALEKPEKLQTRYLKSSQSLAIPEQEAHNIREKHPTGFSQFAEDLTKIDDYEEAKLFETFGEHRPTSYHRYEEVDTDLQEQYEKELNESIQKSETKVIDPFKDEEERRKHIQDISALEALKHERIIYRNDINESPDFQTIENWNFNLRTFQLKSDDNDFTEDNFRDKQNAKLKALQEQNFYPYPAIEYYTVKAPESPQIIEDSKNIESKFSDGHNCTITEIDTEPQYKNIKSIAKQHLGNEHRHTELVNEHTDKILLNSNNIKEPGLETEILENLIVFSSSNESQPIELVENDSDSASEFRFVRNRKPTKFNKDAQTNDSSGFEDCGVQNKKSTTEFRSVKDRTPTKFARDSSTDVSSDLEDGGVPDNHSTTEFRSVKDRRPTKFVRDSMTEESPNSEDKESITGFRSVKDRRPTEFVRDSLPDTQHLNNSDLKNKESVTASSDLVKNYESIKDKEFFTEYQSIKERKLMEFIKNTPAAVSRSYIEYGSTLASKEQRSTGIVKDSVTEALQDIKSFDAQNVNSTTQIMPQIKDAYEQKDIENEAHSWPQFEDEVDIPKVNVRKFNKQDFELQSSVEEVGEYLETTNLIQDSTISFEMPEENGEIKEKFTLNQRRPTGYIKKFSESPDLSETEIWQQENYDTQNHYYSQTQSLVATEASRNNTTYSSTHIEQPEVKFAPQTIANTATEDEDKNSPIKQRRPTGFVRKEHYTVSYNDEMDSEVKTETRTVNPRDNMEVIELQEIWNNMDIEEHTKIQLQVDKFTDFKGEKETWHNDHKERGHTDYKKTQEALDISDEEKKHFEAVKQRRPTDFEQQISVCDEEIYECELENKEIPLSTTVRFMESDYKFNNNEDKPDSLIKQRRPTGFVKKEGKEENMEKQVTFKVEDEKHRDRNLEENEALKQRRPTGHVKKRDLTFLEQPPSIYQATSNQYSPDFDDSLWREMEKEVQEMQSPNIEEEFAKIRNSYELNEGDFLEQKSSFSSPPEPRGFGKSIEDDWENFEKLKTNRTSKALQSPQEIQIIYSEEEITTINTNSILKDSRTEEDIQLKPRKSKVTFDFKTEEHLIPARTIAFDFEHNSDYDDDVYENYPPPVLPPLPPPPEPMQRLSKINYNNEKSHLTPIVTIPSKISLFGSQISEEEADAKEDGWSAIRKHRNLTEQFQNLSPPPEFNTPPPKPSYRNPMAQLAIQRAKEARADMEGFKSRSINDRKPEALKRQRQKVSNFIYDDCTEA